MLILYGTSTILGTVTAPYFAFRTLIILLVEGAKYSACSI